MKLCVAVPCFFGGMDFCEAIKKIGALGFDTAETYNWQKLDLEKVKNACEESGVHLISMCTTEFRMTDSQYRELWLEGLRDSCEAAKKLGVSKLITQVGNDTGAEREFQHAAIVKTLKLAKPITEEYGITVMIEPLNTYVNHPGYYLTSSKEAFDIIKEVDSPYIKVIYDIYHQQVMEGNIIPSVTQNLDCIAHLHAAGHPGRIEPWLGENNYNYIFDAIDKAGYKGFCGLEYKPTLNSEESLKMAKEILSGT